MAGAFHIAGGFALLALAAWVGMADALSTSGTAGAWAFAPGTVGAWVADARAYAIENKAAAFASGAVVLAYLARVLSR